MHKLPSSVSPEQLSQKGLWKSQKVMEWMKGIKLKLCPESAVGQWESCQGTSELAYPVGCCTPLKEQLCNLGVILYPGL